MTPTATKRTADVQNLGQPRRWWRRFRRFGTITVILIAIAGIWGKLKSDAIEAKANQIAATGVELNGFLKGYVHAFETLDLTALSSHYSEDYLNASEGAWAEQQTNDRDGIQVFEWKTQEPRLFRKSDVQTQLDAVLRRVGQIESAKYKISSIEDATKTSARIRGVLWLRGHIKSGQTRESRATFRLWCEREHGVWKIAKQELLKGQTVVGDRKSFSDVTATSGITYKAKHNSMLKQPEWFPKTFGIMKYASGGVTAVDFDNDGLTDVLFPDGEQTTLFKNTGRGTFEDVTAEVGIPTKIGAVHVALFVDLDNDGDKDLFLGRSTGQNYLFRNNLSESASNPQFTSTHSSRCSFTDVSESANVQGLWVATACAGDYDNDGLVDLYLGRYLDPRKNLPTTNFYTRNSEGNSLLHNEGNLSFRDVTAEAGVREGGLSLGVTFGDYDTDGDQDLYVANDFGRNALFRNEGNGTFKDVSVETGTVNIGYGMSAEFADMDNDLDLDLYVGAVHSGQRWFGNSATLQRYLVSSIKQGTILDDYPLYAEMFQLIENEWDQLGEEVISGNTLLLNQDGKHFRNVSEQAGVNPHGWYWSSCSFDYDNDGRNDLYSVNGWITGRTTDDL